MTADPGALLARARAAEEARDYPAVVGLLGEAGPDILLGEPELGYRLAYAWRRVGRTDRALELARSLDVPVRRRGDDRLARRRVSLEAMLRYDIGDVAAAESLWERLAGESVAAEDNALAAAAYNNLGVVRTLQDRPEEALASYVRALLASRRLGDRRGLAQAHQNLGILFREKALPREAAAHFRQAREHAHASGSEDVLGRVEEERALLLLGVGDAAMARASAHRALERLEAIGDETGVGEALRVLGIIALREGEQERAREALNGALERAAAAGSALLRAETLTALALLEATTGSAPSASTMDAEAVGLFDAMGAGAWGRRIRARTADLANLPPFQPNAADR